MLQKKTTDDLDVVLPSFSWSMLIMHSFFSIEIIPSVLLKAVFIKDV
jgi:hypothetical protein